ncbi:microtubule-associated serine/threonine-protein kinase 2-like [Alligator sinensis]|uniref:Microtubule-associated serine/threonine-protein kinase 2-like n=1 Tax=Alligator sinensis TaxID=38654 RepID=A0A3Q0GSZ0_ALLSI|nr:microtubule-associated serine/threonine-protein kinase 2-like [Alligator sinensis]
MAQLGVRGCTELCSGSAESEDVVIEPPPLRCRKLSNPDIFSSTGKTKLHRQLSQDDCKLRRGSLASSLSGKQLLPLSNSVHSGVGQSVWQPYGDTSNLVRMRNQSLGQSAPSLTAGLFRVVDSCSVFIVLWLAEDILTLPMGQEPIFCQLHLDFK